MGQSCRQLAQGGQFLGLTQLFSGLHFFPMEGGIFYGNGRLAGEQGQQPDVTLLKTTRFCRIDIQDADNISLGPQRNGEQ